MMTLTHHLHKSRYHSMHVYTLHKNICQDIWGKIEKIDGNDAFTRNLEVFIKIQW